MADQHDTTGMMLGEIKGQMRELIHNVNNMATKLDALTREVVSNSSLPGKVKELDERVTVLEGDKNKRDGASGMVANIMKSPAIGWLVGAAVSAWAILTGKVHP